MTAGGSDDRAPSGESREPDSGPQPGWPQRVIEADKLFAGSREIFIAHNGEHYRLRITQSGKLILTK